jgi:hypothetical protein
VSRRCRPHFSQLNRRLDPGVPAPRRANARTPLAKPKDEPGVLWDAFRERLEDGAGPAG